MHYGLRIKTGFYETTLYDLSMLEGGILLAPYDNEANPIIKILPEDLNCITLTKKKHSEIEIKTRSLLFWGTFIEDTDLRAIYQELKKHVEAKVIYEEE